MTATRLPRWFAGPDGTAHASSRGSPRTLCGRPAVRERDAWPETRQCFVCRVFVDRLFAERRTAQKKGVATA